VPREKRGEIWLLLVEQHRLHRGLDVETVDDEESEKYEDLLKKLTLHQHAILIDLGLCGLTCFMYTVQRQHAC